MTDAPIPLHRNESYWLLDGLEDFLDIDVRACSSYPSYDELTAVYAAYLSVPGERLLLAPGSDAGIANIADWSAREGKRAVLPIPTFYGYERILSARSVPAQYVYHSITDGTPVFPAEETLKAMQGPDTVVFLCQPNNPFGQLIPAADMDRMLTRARQTGTFLVIDEAYAEFDNPSYVEAANGPIVVLRTLSKGFGLAGLRIGATIAEPSLLRAFAAHVLPWPIAHSSVHIALSVLSHQREIAGRRRALMEIRDTFIRRLQAMAGVTTLDSSTNFVYAAVPDAPSIAEALRERAILVALGRDLSFDTQAKAMLEGGIRIATPAPEHLDVVCTSLEEALSETATWN